jgi:hypothetical protein
MWAMERQPRNAKAHHEEEGRVQNSTVSLAGAKSDEGGEHRRQKSEAETNGREAFHGPLTSNSRRQTNKRNLQVAAVEMEN